MKALLQRVTQAKVGIGNKTVGEIGPGFLVLLGVGQNDAVEDIDYLVNKIINLRVFADENEKFNLSVKDVKGSLLIVSQFTLFADTKKGNRPGFTDAAPPALAEELYNKFVEKCKDTGINTKTGIFASHMQISLVNDGPVTIILDSKEKLSQ
jgi:D-aminoacyl-tRNA deacylase